MLCCQKYDPEKSLIIKQQISTYKTQRQGSRVMRKTDICICKNKDVLCCNCNRIADCFRYLESKDNSSSTYIQNFKLLAFLCDFTGWFVSELVRNPYERFSHYPAQYQFCQKKNLFVQLRMRQCHILKSNIAF